jgi:tyrosine-specific transport protein
LDITGSFGDSLLNGVIPVLLVWVGRYVIGYKSELKLFGGKATLVFLFLGSISIIATQIMKWMF